MDRYFAYVRVSTLYQSQVGVSLQEQREAIAQFAETRGIGICRWFQETAPSSRRGRRLFQEMVERLGRGEARGVIIHKIDRSARNLRDWADLGELIDRGVDVRFAHDDLCLSSRGGRLAADIQAVIAADYVRNLREEVHKGFLGRLKQGLYPLPAPIGYVDRGSGKPKTIHPRFGPLVAETFRLYATGEFSIRQLREKMHERGLVNRNGRVLNPTTMSQVLRNAFYVGLIRIRTTGEEFPGAHRALVGRELFDAVQKRLRERACRRTRPGRHEWTYARLVYCTCGRFLTGEGHKGHVYYRCHQCSGVCVREEKLEEAMIRVLGAADAKAFHDAAAGERRLMLQSANAAAIYMHRKKSVLLSKSSNPIWVSPKLAEF